MWKVVIYNGNELVLEHSQNDYGKVLRFAVNGLAELMNNNAQDFRIVLTNKEGNTYLFVCGPTTQLSNFRKDKND